MEGEQSIPLYTDRTSVMITKAMGFAFLLLGLVLGGLLFFFHASGYLLIEVMPVVLLLVIGDFFFSALELEMQDGTLLLKGDGIEVRYLSPCPIRKRWAHTKLFHIPVPVSPGGFAKWNAVHLFVVLPLPAERKSNLGNLRFKFVGGNTGGHIHTFDVLGMLDERHGAELLSRLAGKGVQMRVHRDAWSALKEVASVPESRVSRVESSFIHIN